MRILVICHRDPKIVLQKEGLVRKKYESLAYKISEFTQHNGHMFFNEKQDFFKLHSFCRTFL